MTPRLIVAGILLAVAALTFVGLAFQTVPMSTTSTLTQTIPQQYVESEDSSSTYVISSTENQTAPIVWVGSTIAFGRPITSFQVTATIQYSYTSTSSTTLTSTTSTTSLVPASQALGLTDETFSVLAVAVIGLLSLLTILIALKSKS